MSDALQRFRELCPSVPDAVEIETRGASHVHDRPPLILKRLAKLIGS